jgi:hypothetical protein
MSFGAGWTAANNWHGDYDKVGNLSSVANYGNAHTYPTGAPDTTIQQLVGDAQLAAPGQPVIQSEFGYDTSSVSQTQIASWTLDGLLDSFALGVTTTYLYALYDDSSGNWGLFNSDGSPRPAATAIHNMTTLLSDSGSGGTGSLNYSLSGGSSGDQSLLMEKSDGTFWLAVWNENSTGENLTLNLGSAAGQITEFNPMTGTSAVATASGSSFSFSLSNSPVLIEVGGAQSGTATPTATPTTTTTATTTGAATTTATTTPAPAATTTSTSDAAQNIVATVSNSTITAGNGDNNVFLQTTGNTVTLGNGNNTVQGYAGGNSITTGTGNDTIRYAGSGNTINAGGGQNHLEDSGSNNTIVLNQNGNDDIFGYVLQQGDTLNLTPALTSAGWNGDSSTLGNYVQTSTTNNSAVISVGGSTVATLENSGPVSLSTLLQHSTI